MTPYWFWEQQARRYQAIVDYASPTTAWTAEMFEILNKHNQDKVAATHELRIRRLERRKQEDERL